MRVILECWRLCTTDGSSRFAAYPSQNRLASRSLSPIDAEWVMLAAESFDSKDHLKWFHLLKVCFH